MADAGAAMIGTIQIGPAGLGEALRVAAESPTLLVWPGAVCSALWPSFAAALAGLAADRRIAGAMLAVPRARHGSSAPFVAIEDGGDVFYSQHVVPAAVLLTAEAAGAAAADGIADAAGLSRWLAANGLYLAAPRAPLAHAGWAGGRRMLLAAPRDWRVTPLDEALAVYDPVLEIAPAAAARLCPALAGAPFAVDLWGERADGGEGLLLSARPCAAPTLTFGLELVPPEANLAAPGGGDFFAFGAARDFAPMADAKREALFRHATRYNAMDDYVGQFLGPLNRLRRRR